MNSDAPTLPRADSLSTMAAGAVFSPAETPPGYEILSELGRGGMGVVYKARQTSLNRVVALKMLLSGRAADGESLARFKSEAETVAQLQHANFVQVYEIGQHADRPFFAMEFIDGSSLSAKLDGAPMPHCEAAALVRTLALAIERMHEKGIVHRDLKPANILLDAEGTPKIADFGLAKHLNADSGQTRSGAILGTPSYMAPEQAGGKKSVGHAADVYALGAILYELLTGRPPFRATTPVETLLQVLENDPAPPRLLNPKVDPDVETICLKCLEKDPAHRYPTARALANDLDRCLSGESISARSFNLVERLARTLHRTNLDEGLKAWSSIVFWFAAIVLVVQIALFAVIGSRQAVPWVLLTQASQFVMMGLVLWWFRSINLSPANAAHRHLWSLWIGFLLACGTVAAVSHGLLEREQVYSFFNYPYWAVVSGLAFVAMGSRYWGWFYAFGLAFFCAGLLLPLCPAAGPLAFGALWAVALTATGFRLRRMGKGV